MLRGVVILSFACFSFACMAGFGTIEKFRITHPEFFDVGKVSVVTNNGVSYYVCNGQATRYFRDIPVGHDSRLRQVSRLGAHKNLSKFLVKDARNSVIELSGLIQIGKEVYQDRVFYLFAVPVANVKVVSTTDNKAKGSPIATNAIPSLVASGRIAAGEKLSQNTKVKETRVLDDSWMDLLDAVERNPNDARSYALLADVYFKMADYDEAEIAARRAAELLIPYMNSAASNDDIKALLLSADILFECADYYRARDAYLAVKKLNQSEYNSKLLKGLSKIRLKIGMD